MAGDTTEERTEQATPKHKSKARKDGQIGNSPELGTWLALLGATFVLPHMFSSIMSNAAESLVRAGAVIRTPDIHTAIGMAKASMTAAFMAAIPLGVVVAGIAVISAALQGGIWFSAKAFTPQFKRLNPISGMKRVFGPQAAWQLCKQLLKVLGVALVVYITIRKFIPTIYGAGSLSVGSLLEATTGTALSVLRYAAAAGLVMAIADIIVVRRRNNKSLKMTKKQVKDEMKDSEGDPLVRSQRRSRALAMARNRMMADVPFADVVLVNPTHVAVALRYDPKRGAPRVVAKGADNLAAKIREIAEKNRVPMVRDIALARTLYASVDVGREIPPDLYKAVATVLAFIMTLKRRGSAAGTHTVRPLAAAAAR